MADNVCSHNCLLGTCMCMALLGCFVSVYSFGVNSVVQDFIVTDRINL